MPNLLASKLPELTVASITPINHYIYDLQKVTFWVCMVVCVSVFSVLIYSLIKHRESSGHEAAAFHSSLKVEILWAVIPFLIVLVLVARSIFSYALF